MIKKREMICLLRQGLESIQQFKHSGEILDRLEQQLNECDKANNCDTCGLFKPCYGLWVKIVDKSNAGYSSYEI